MRPAAPPPPLRPTNYSTRVGRPARVHQKKYWQQASKRGAAKELRFFGFLPADVAIVHVLGGVSRVSDLVLLKAEGSGAVL